MSGRDREDNIFSTLNDSMDAMKANDTDELHNLIAEFKVDMDRVLSGRAEVGSRMDRLLMMEQRHADEKVNFTKVRAERVDLDFSEAIIRYQAHQNVFEASLRTTGQLIPMSLVDFI